MNKNYQRHCCLCNAPISACMGFVVAGDFSRYTDGQISREEVRELCGREVLKYSLEDLTRVLNLEN